MSRYVADPGPPTLGEAIDGIHGEIMLAARATAAAHAALVNTAPLERDEDQRARGAYSAAKAIGDHWRNMLNHYTARLRLHPELDGRPLNTRCRHARGPIELCAVGDALGYFVEPGTAPVERHGRAGEQLPISGDSRLPPERDVGADDGEELT